jgi:hypothetical protein
MEPSFVDTLDGPSDLVINSVGSVSFDKDVGGITPLNTLTVTAGNQILINANALDTFGITTQWYQTYNGTVALTPNGTITTPYTTLTTSSGGAGDITFNGTITINQTGPFPTPDGRMGFFLNADHDVIFKGVVALNTVPLWLGQHGGYLDVTAGHQIIIDTPTIDTGIWAVCNGCQGQSFSFHSPVILMQDLVITAATGGLSGFYSTIDGNTVGGQSLTVDVPDVIDIAGNIGSNTALSSLAILNSYSPFGGYFASLRFRTGLASITTTGNQDYHPPIFYFDNGGMTYTSLNNGTVHFYAENTAYYPGERVAIEAGYARSVIVNGNAEFDGDIIPLIAANQTNVSILTGPVSVTGSTIFRNGASIDSMSQNYQGPVTMDGGIGGQVILNSTGTIHFASTVDSISTPTTLIINNADFTPFSAGTVQLDGAIGSSVNLNNLEITGAVINLNLPSVQTTGNQLYHSPVVLQANIDSPGMVAGGNIIFDSTVDGGFNLTANAIGIIQFNNFVGSSPLDTLDLTASEIQINTAWINTLNDQNYHSPVVLMTDVDFGGLGMRSIFGVVTYYSTLNGDGLGPWNVAITAGSAVRFKGDIGTAPLNSLNALSVNADIINFDGAVTAITTVGTQMYTGATLMSMNADPVFSAPNFVINIPTLINANTTYNSTAGNIDFQQLITGDGVSSLTLNPVGGSAMFEGDVGTVGSPLGSLIINGSSIFDMGSPQNVITTGNQTYGSNPTDTVTMMNDLSMSVTGLATGQIVYGGLGVFDAPAYTFTLSATTANSANGPTGQGITGTVHVGNLTLGGAGGANLSQNYPVTESFVTNQGGQQARTNTTAPANVAGVVIYCVNGFNCTPAPGPTPTPTPTPIDNIPPTQVFNPPVFNFCAAGGCGTLEVVIDNLEEAGIVSCGGGQNGCAYGFVEAKDTNGNSRILMPGDVVYAGDRISKNSESCMCIKSIYSKKKTCMGPGKTKAVYEK